jgi:hypothetical protein
VWKQSANGDRLALLEGNVMSLQSRTRWRASLISTVALATGLSLGSLPAAHATPDGHWTTLSKGNIDTVRQPAVHRFGRDLQAIWTQPQGQRIALYTRIIGANGKPKTAAIRIMVWDGIIEDPVIFGIGSQRVIAFSGLRNGNTPDPYTSGAEFYLTSPNGTAWTLGTGSLSQSTAAFGSYGTAAIDYNGSPLVAFTEASTSRITFHHGIDSHIPAATADGHTSSTGNFAYSTGLGEDKSTSNVWAIWYSNSGKPRTTGVDAQRIYPTEGALVHAPASFLARGGAATSTAPDQDLPAVSRPASAGGGVYTAYATPSDRSIVVWRVGARHPAFIVRSVNTAGQVSLGAGPHGKLWLFWRDGNNVRATRSNAAATRAGAIRTIAPPRGTTAYRIAGDGALGPLDVVSLFSAAHGSMDSAQILPGLSGSASRVWRRGHRYTVKVTDAGAPVAGAVVSFAGHKAHTNRHGIARLTTSSRASLGHGQVRISHRGYAGARVRVTVTNASNVRGQS